MTVLELRFPAGRYHATPWGRHVNEGAVEWPPSPWRIVRALIATWYLKARNIPEHTMRALAAALCEPPVFRLSGATAAHTRHYMPYNEGKNEKTTKVFDTFIQLSERSAMLVAWNVVLPPEQFSALETLAGRLGYFGRAESLVEARVLEGVMAIEPNAEPHSEGTPLPPKTELVRLLAPMTPAAYNKWREDFLQANRPSPAGKSQTSKKAKANEAPIVPEDSFNALHAETGELQSAGWNLPPGALYVNYTRPENAFAPAARPRPRRGKAALTVARYAVVSAVAPSITQAVSVADRVHDSLCKLSDQGKGCAAVFAGLGEDGKPRTDHCHAHILLEANGPRDAITHMTIWAPMRFDETACLALRRLSKVWGHGGHDIRLVLHGIGQPGDFIDCALFGQAKVWRSLTPFVSTRHAKTFRDGRPKVDVNGWQIGSAGHDLLRLLALHPQGNGATIKQFDEREGPFRYGSRRFRSLQFRTIRHNGGGNRGNSSGNAFTITFPNLVSGPLALGYGSHFGLGLFVPIAS
jgi:CRISPR-associated protein Csb2